MFREDQENRPVSGFTPKSLNTRSSYTKGEASELDNDPNSVSIIRELLNSDGEWATVPEILKLTMTAFYKVLSSHSSTFQEMGNALVMKANKVDVQSLLSSKLNIKDFKQTVAEVSEDIESKASLSQVHKIIESQLNSGLSSRGSKQPEFSQQLEDLQVKVRDIFKEINLKLADYDQILNDHKSELDNKANIDNINELLNNKANKRTVAEALHRKANKEEVEKIMANKITAEDIDRIIGQLNEKANISDIHHLENLIESKTDRNELREMIQTRSSPDKESVDRSFLNTLQREKDLNSSKIENLELTIKSHIKKIDSELKTIIDNFNSGLAKKADFRDIEGIGANIYNKADIGSVTEMISEAKDSILEKFRKIKDDFNNQRKDIYEEMYDRYNKQSTKIEKCIKDVKSIKDTSKDINKENKTIRSDVKGIIFKEAELISSQVREEINKAVDELHTARIKIDHELSQKVRKGDLVELKNDVAQMIDSKVGESEVQTALNNLQSDLANRLVNTKLEVQNNLSSVKDNINHQLSKKCNVDEVNEMLSCKMDTHHCQQLLEKKANKVDIDSIKGVIDRIIREVDLKISGKDLQHHIDFTRSSIEDMTKEILQKAQAKDLVKLDDEKVGRDEMERIFQNMTKELQDKVSSQEVKASLDEQALINEALCSENCLGRWVWKSGELKASCLVPWEIQCVNTCPDNFIWEKNKTSIICISPGLYELSMGIFSKKNPNVQIQVNGEGILTLFKDADTIERHNSTKIKDLGSHSAGNITGLTHQDYISLPARARVSFIFDGMSKAEGFLSLKKL
ncbi:unnamed protein product [Moneuplotes crassus]|uniref:Uncharacterized protein n=1 Tax=Euplotes crassus TaxID=5936 RepID=A0AAD2D9R5_EUPCR|nr:unnamed protein product [Moneuplotes crassus]